MCRKNAWNLPADGTAVKREAGAAIMTFMQCKRSSDTAWLMSLPAVILALLPGRSFRGPPASVPHDLDSYSNETYLCSDTVTAVTSRTSLYRTWKSFSISMPPTYGL